MWLVSCPSRNVQIDAVIDGHHNQLPRLELPRTEKPGTDSDTVHIVHELAIIAYMDGVTGKLA